ncbi:COQ9 family protein [Poseidonocella sedimentorum]|uniref:Ubiquinone biosynthesis protein COQ9 n=1 Tax=Poseidonocella sedimentorum TaxID=871652 RepID=A0A1I6DUN0_9RHOB|nr:COQ9 family protein [Poseidonocella sedimentorum]SFR09220.1 ubiquinone biosynthesis protein COQ9 [Poseidonocella sedimentorum]
MTADDEDIRAKLLDAALMHVPFDGWTRASFTAAVRDSGIDPALAEAICPRGALDLAVAFHRRGDAQMVARLEAADLAGMRFRDRIAAAVRYRLEATQDKEAVRRGVTLFALPPHAPEGAKLIWGTCDLIWTTLGDSSDDLNWYTKRATLSGVYSSTVLYWLGDTSPGHQQTWEFLDRRIDDVMQIEKLKAKARKAPVLGALLAGPNWLASRVRAPKGPDRDAEPGHWASGS